MAKTKLSKKSPAKKSPVKKASTKKSPLKKSSPKKATSKKAPAKKSSAKKVASKKSPPKKATSKKSESASFPEMYKGLRSVSEIEIIRRDADKYLSGRKVKTVEVLKPKALVGTLTQGELKKVLIGNEISAVTRYGMSLVFELSKNIGCFVVTLGEGGQLRRHIPSENRDSSYLLILSFLKGGQLRINSHLEDTQIRFFKTDKQADGLLEIKGKGMDSVNTPIPKELFVGLIRSQNEDRVIKEVLQDPDFIVGLSDIYCDEVLYKSGLKYDRQLKTIPDIKLILLLRNMVETLYEAIKYRGTTLEGGFFCDLDGTAGSYQDYLQVYGRDGELTSTLYEVEKARFKKSWAYFCPILQT